MAHPLASSECSGDVVAVARSEAGHCLHVSAKIAVDRAPCGPGAGGLVVGRASERASERAGERASGEVGRQEETRIELMVKEREAQARHEQEEARCEAERQEETKSELTTREWEE